jgi:three-Cys-motif partner protein
MARKKAPSQIQSDHRFGGDWTQTKLDVIEKYLSAYTTALKNKRFRIAYIDAFAGTGSRLPSRAKAEHEASETLFADRTVPEPQALQDGSVRIALKTSPRFDKYIFIEQSVERCAALEALKGEFPALSSDIVIRQGEANKELRALCAKDWRHRRAVLFLDPYGMQVEWTTLEAIAHTKAIDLWLLFPLGIGVNRLVTRSGEIPEA